MAKAEFGRSWWSQRFVSAIEEFTDSGRLSRGRSYARGSKVKSFNIKDGLVTAQVRGSFNINFDKKPALDAISPIAAFHFASLIAENSIEVVYSGSLYTPK